MTTAIYPGVYMQERRKAILCLCHDSGMLQVRQMILEHFGYTVLPTTSLEDAKLQAEGACPDMLLMDNNYPGVNLQEFAHDVKQRCPAVMAVVLSPFFAMRSADGAIDRFVTNDEGPDALIAQIDELFEKRQTADNSESASA